MAGRVLALVFAWLALALAASGAHAQAAPSVPAQLDHAQADLRDLRRSAAAAGPRRHGAGQALRRRGADRGRDPPGDRSAGSAAGHSRRAAERARAGAQARRAAGSRGHRPRPQDVLRPARGARRPDQARRPDAGRGRPARAAARQPAHRLLLAARQRPLPVHSRSGAVERGCGQAAGRRRPVGRARPGRGENRARGGEPPGVRSGGAVHRARPGPRRPGADPAQARGHAAVARAPGLGAPARRRDRRGERDRPLGHAGGGGGAAGRWGCSGRGSCRRGPSSSAGRSCARWGWRRRPMRSGGPCSRRATPSSGSLAVSDRTAAALSAYPLVLGVAAAVGSLLLHANRIAGISLAAEVAARALVAVADLVILALAASAVGRARAAEYAAQDDAGRPERGRGLWTLALVPRLDGRLHRRRGAALRLHHRSPSFLTQEIAWTGIIAAVTFVLTNLTDAFFAELAPDRGVVGRFVASAMGIGARTLDQLSVLLAGVARVVLWLLALAVVMTPFGAGTRRDVLAPAGEGDRLQAGRGDGGAGGDRGLDRHLRDRPRPHADVPALARDPVPAPDAPGRRPLGHLRHGRELYRGRGRR